MPFDVQGYLRGKGLRGRPASGGRELVYPCFFDCAEPADSKKKKLYISTEESLYSCKVCGAFGGSTLLQRHFGDDPKGESEDVPFLRRRILNEAAEQGHAMLVNREDVLHYLLDERGLSAETIVERKLGFVASGWSLVGTLKNEYTRDQLAGTGLVHTSGPRSGQDFFFEHLLIPVVVRGQVVTIRGRAWGQTRGGKYMSGPGEPVRAYNLDSLDGAEEVILTEGELDAAVLAQHLAGSGGSRLKNMAVVGLPGTSAVPEDLEDYLRDIKRVFVGFDSDEPGKIAADKLAIRLGARARVLELPNAGRKCDWTEYLLPTQGPDHPYGGHTAEDVARVLSAASGKRIFSVAEAGDAFRRYRATNSGLLTGWDELDAVLAPGLLPGQVMFILAKTGTGKTLVLCNLAFQMRQHRILFISLEMTREEVYHRLERIYLFHFPQASTTELEEGWRNIWINDENRLTEPDIGLLVSEYEVEMGAPPDLVLVDYLGYYARGAKGNSPYEKVSNAAMQLKADAKSGRMVVISPVQVNRVAKDGKPIDLDSARDAGSVEETGDFVVAVFRPDNALNVGDALNARPSYKMKVSVLKSRHGGVGRVLTLQMDALTLAVVPDGTQDARRAEEHNYLSWRGKTWEELRADETAPVQMRLGEGT